MVDPRHDDLGAATAWLEAIHGPEPDERKARRRRVAVTRYPPPVPYDPRVVRTLAFLTERVGQATYRRRNRSRWEPPVWPDDHPPNGSLAVVADPHALKDRSAAILLADGWTPTLQFTLGLVGRFPELGPVAVRCRDCKRRWTCQIEDEYFGGKNKSDGLCLSCALADCRPDLAVAALEGKIVEATTGDFPAVAGGPAAKGEQ